MVNANEHTPLIQTVVIARPRDRYSHSTLRRFCTISLISTLLVIVILFLLPSGLLPGLEDHRNHLPFWPLSGWLPSSWPESEGVSFENLQRILLETPDGVKTEEWSKYYTAGPHLAGKNISQALWTKVLWQGFGIPQAEIATYDVYINYPKDHRLALLHKTSADENTSSTAYANREAKVVYECTLEEDVLEEDPTTGLPDRIPTFHGYSASGNVTAQYVYVNFGTYEDFEDLRRANISLKGNIAVAKYGKIFRGLKVRRAEDLGMVGVVIYTDPQEDGQITEENGYETYPAGPARNPSSVQRGSVQPINIAPGDPTTPGYPSLPGVPRQDPQPLLPSIPSIPISYAEALPILQSLNGHGPEASSFNDFWQGGGLAYKGVDYNIGPSPPELVLNLVNEQEYVTTPLWNVIGIVNGIIPDEVVVIGNHRDAWIAGGAGDPNSGSAALNEVIRGFGIALSQGWKPLRTIVFASWDGEEYGLLGSTEWVEEYLPWLSGSAIAYLNVDVGARGPRFSTAASPVLNKALYEITSLVPSPNQTTPGQNIRDTWDGHIRTMGSGSDFTAFQDFAGVPSIDFGFAPDTESPVYHYHSNFDSFYWMKNFGDPGFEYHVTMAKILGLFAVQLVESPLIYFNATDYANELGGYFEKVEDLARQCSNNAVRNISFQDLAASIYSFQQACHGLDARADALAIQTKGYLPWWKQLQKVKLWLQVRSVNTIYKFLERKFLYQEGLDDRSFFKHIVFAPGKWTGYSGATFPGLVEGIAEGNAATVERWRDIITGKIQEATKSLGG